MRKCLSDRSKTTFVGRTEVVQLKLMSVVLADIYKVIRTDGQLHMDRLDRSQNDRWFMAQFARYRLPMIYHSDCFRYH